MNALELVTYTTQEDIALSLIKGFWRMHNDQEVSDEEAREDLRVYTSQEHVLYLVKYKDKYIGFAHLASRGASIDWLEDIYIIPECQGKGYGSYVISLLEKRVSEYSSSFYMEVAARNERAMRLYHRLGYTCLNTVTLRKDFAPEKYECIRNEKIYDMELEIRKKKL
ncbi:MAG: GNAT family N-acetyltransferase [Erysipelotrichales bacterium]|nr:GNAT family N-acetyltransferase [Erysipelotrichales bacterium]